MTTHTRDYYFFRMAKEVVPGEIISWRNDASKLVLSGWSPAEQEFRWSQNRRVGICFKPDKALFQQSEYNGELSVTIEFVPIPALEGKEIQFSLSPNGATGSATIAHGRSFYTISGVFELSSDIFCLQIILPFTVKENSGHPRDLGIRLYSVAFN
jgi:hypothetical protein